MFKILQRKISAPKVLELPDDVIFFKILPRLDSQDVLPMILVSKIWASFILKEGPGLMLFNQPENPVPNSILIALEPIPDSVLLELPPDSILAGLSQETGFLVTPIINSCIRPTFPLFTVRPNFIGKGEIPCVVGSCSGIICLHIASRFVLINPLTKYYKEVSAPQASIPHFEASKPNAGFFYDESNKDMKIVQFLRWDLRASFDLSGPKTIHALRAYSVQSGKWESVGLEAIKIPDYICGVWSLPKPLAVFVDAYCLEPENCFLVDFEDYCLKPVPVFGGGGAELCRDCVCWIDKVGIRAQNCIHVLDEQLATWKVYTTIPDELSKNVISFCLDGGNIVVLGGSGQRNLSDCNLYNSTNGLHHILSLPTANHQLFPHVATLFCIEGMIPF